MSKHLISQYLRIEGIKERLEERILALAYKQSKYNIDISKDVLKSSYSQIYFDYLKIEDFTGIIQYWRRGRSEPDERVSYNASFNVHELILNGKDDEYKQLVRDELSIIKIKQDEVQNSRLIARKKVLEEEISQLNREIKIVD